MNLKCQFHCIRFLVSQLQIMQMKLQIGISVLLGEEQKRFHFAIGSMISFYPNAKWIIDEKETY